MLAQDEDAIARPIESRDELIAYLEAGCKPRADWRIGTEHEKIGYRRDDLRPVPYDERSIEALLKGVAERFRVGAGPRERQHCRAEDPCCEHGGSITLEPGGQFELSGAPLTHVHETCREVHTHLAQVREVADALDIGFIAIGFSPKWTLAKRRSCPSAATRSCGATCPRSGGSGAT